MTIGFGEKGIQKARDAHGSVSPWVSPGPSIAIPSHGNWELSIPQSLSAPLVSTSTPHHSQVALAGAHSIAITGFCFPNTTGSCQEDH